MMRIDCRRWGRNDQTSVDVMCVAGLFAQPAAMLCGSQWQWSVLSLKVKVKDQRY